MREEESGSVALVNPAKDGLPLRVEIGDVIQDIHEHDLVQLVALRQELPQKCDFRARVEPVERHDVDFPAMLLPPDPVGEPVVDVGNPMPSGERVSEERDARSSRPLPHEVTRGVVADATRVDLVVPFEPAFRHAVQPERVGRIAPEPVVALEGEQHGRQQDREHQQIPGNQDRALSAVRMLPLVANQQQQQTDADDGQQHDACECPGISGVIHRRHLVNAPTLDRPLRRSEE